MAVFLVAGNSHSIARRTDGTVWTWGNDELGQLGLGDPAMTFRSVPTQVAGVSNAREVAIGASTSLFLASDGFVHACGSHTSIQLGRPATAPQTSFLPVQRFRRPRAISAGWLHCLAAYKGQVFAWGRNQHGGFGIGTQGELWTYPRPLPGVDGVSQAICGRWGQSFLLRRSGPRVLAAGRNNYGQLGDGTTQDRLEFVPIPGMSDVVAVSASSDFTLALRDDGTVWAWGRNHVGQLGDGTLVDRPTPARVGQLRRIVAISAGGAHGLALDDAGRISGWGLNTTAQLGDDGSGNFSVRRVPAKIPMKRPIVALSTGGGHSLAVDDHGDLWGWGYNVNGQVGTGSAAPHVFVPTRVTGISQVG